MSKRLLTTTLPSAEQIVLRMATVNAETNLVTKLYPVIAQKAGVTLNTMGIINMLLLAFYDFDSQYNSPVITATLNMSVPDYIKALVDDAAFVEEAIEFNNVIGIASAAHQST